MNKFFTWIKSLFQKAVKAFKSLLKEAFSISKQIILGQLAEFGEKVVAELQEGNLSGEEKRQEAFNRLKAKAEELGLETRASLINALIEIIVQKFKNDD